MTVDNILLNVSSYYPLPPPCVQATSSWGNPFPQYPSYRRGQMMPQRKIREYVAAAPTPFLTLAGATAEEWEAAPQQPLSVVAAVCWPKQAQAAALRACATRSGARWCSCAAPHLSRMLLLSSLWRVDGGFTLKFSIFKRRWDAGDYFICIFARVCVCLCVCWIFVRTVLVMCERREGGRGDKREKNKRARNSPSYGADCNLKDHFRGCRG